MGVTEVENPDRFGVAEVENGRLKKIAEKPQNPKSNLINAGLFIFTPAIFSEIRKTKKSVRGEYEITDTLNSIAEKEEVLVYVLKDYWIDIGVPQDLLKASELLPQTP
jgi:bifunctional UDP-N-acetylglucosamine pyrophosphorylase/glucosamine-1-phosphate N-acetyltransferase